MNPFFDAFSDELQKIAITMGSAEMLAHNAKAAKRGWSVAREQLSFNRLMHSEGAARRGFVQKRITGRNVAKSMESGLEPTMVRPAPAGGLSHQPTPKPPRAAAREPLEMDTNALEKVRNGGGSEGATRAGVKPKSTSQNTQVARPRGKVTQQPEPMPHAASPQAEKPHGGRLGLKLKMPSNVMMGGMAAAGTVAGAGMLAAHQRAQQPAPTY